MASDTLDDSGDLRRLEQALARIKELGYAQVEMDVSLYGFVIDGKIRQAQFEAFCSVLKNFDFRYSIHSPNRLNLAYDPRHELSRSILLRQIEICRAIGGTRVVYHSGLESLSDVAHGVRRTLLTDKELREGERREVQAFKELAPIAADAGVVVCMENGDSHQWEHTVIASFDLPRETLLKYHARLDPQNVVRQLEEIDHPNVAMTLDIAHLHIAAHDMGFDYLKAVETAAPWAKHLHVNDNFGRLDRGYGTESDRWAYGEADIHLPPGWGSIPYREVLARLPDYEGALILEIKPGFRDHLGECLSTMKRLVDDSGQA